MKLCILKSIIIFWLIITISLCIISEDKFCGEFSCFTVPCLWFFDRCGHLSAVKMGGIYYCYIVAQTNIYLQLQVKNIHR